MRYGGIVYIAYIYGLVLELEKEREAVTLDDLLVKK